MRYVYNILYKKNIIENYVFIIYVYYDLYLKKAEKNKYNFIFYKFFFQKRYIIYY